jgi:hypothetical protein
MSDVTGPISSLPGSLHAAQGMCDDHPDRPAVARLQGETDSFGSEMHDVCQECLDEHRQHQAEARTGFCDWCRTEQTTLRDHRDFEEGMSGPVYRVCGPCRKKESESLREEADERYNDYLDHECED